MCCTAFTPESRERIPRLSDVGNLAADRTAAVQMVLAAADFASCDATGGTIGAFADAFMAQAAAHEPVPLKDRDYLLSVYYCRSHGHTTHTNCTTIASSLSALFYYHES